MRYSQWCLTEIPAGGTFETGDFRASAAQDEALARLEYLVGPGRHVGLLLGESGTGKTLLLSVFAQRCRASHAAVAHMNLKALGASDFTELLADQIGIPRRPDAAGGFWRRISDRLLEHGYTRRNTVILLDDANCGKQEVFESVERVIAMDASGAAGVTVVLACPPQKVGRLPRSIRGAIDLRMDLTSWDLVDTRAYVAELMSVGAADKRVCDENAIARIHDLADGNPRRICRLTNLVVLAAAGDNATTIDAATVDAAADQLTLIGQEPSIS